jgi:rare lipoprotein A
MHFTMRILLLTAVLVLGFSGLQAQAIKAKSDTGVASYYADKFQGRKTASGEVFHQDSLTAAHKYLPFGTLVKVTNLRNNQSVIVKVNDRGMRGTNRVIDLSKAAARELNMVGAGLVKVKVEVLE